MPRQIRGVVVLLCLSAPTAAGEGCEIPGYPSPPGGVMNLGLSWCPASISLPVRSLALHAAGAHCALATGRSSTPEQIQPRRQDIQTACEGLAALNVSNCQCPPELLSLPLSPALTPASAPLPPEIQLDRYLLGAEKLMAQKDHQAALDIMGKILALQKEHQLSLPEEFHFTHAELAFAAGAFQAALDAVNEYLVKAGRGGEFYREALDLLDDVEAALPERNRCTGQPKGSECWMALTDRPGCYVWDPNFQPDATVTWTAECAEGLAQGTGTLNWVLERRSGDSRRNGTAPGRSAARAVGFPLREWDRHGRLICGGEETRAVGLALRGRESHGRLVCGRERARPVDFSLRGWDRRGGPDGGGKTRGTLDRTLRGRDRRRRLVRGGETRGTVGLALHERRGPGRLVPGGEGTRAVGQVQERTRGCGSVLCGWERQVGQEIRWPAAKACPGWDSNPHGGEPPQDFKSCASANSATRAHSSPSPNRILERPERDQRSDLLPGKNSDVIGPRCSVI